MMEQLHEEVYKVPRIWYKTFERYIGMYFLFCFAKLLCEYIEILSILEYVPSNIV